MPARPGWSIRGRRIRKWLRRRGRRHATSALQAIPVYALYGLMWLLPLDVASALGGGIGRTVGPRIRASRRADANLCLVMPELSAAERQRVIRGMWDNLGRVIAEFPHLGRLRRGEGRRPRRIRVEGIDHFLAARDGGRGVVMAIGHFGNWEVGAAVAANHGVPFTAIARPPKNPLVGWLLHRIRSSVGTILLEKRMEGSDAKRALSVLRAGGVLGMMVDQRYNGGLKVPFMGHDAMTSPGAVAMAYHLGCEVIPVRIERLAGARYLAVFERPLAMARTGDRKADIEAATIALNGVVEGWVRGRPEQWLWLHKRWMMPRPRKLRQRVLAYRASLAALGDGEA
jgi:KDO2-lipid IV(A) lauroyltransferase